MTNNVPAAFQRNVLQLIILPTEKCNFRCTYCYEDFKIGKLKRPTIDGIKNLISARVEGGTLDHLLLSWFGGEPLLALDAMYEISAHAKSYFDSGKLKSFSGDSTTNAYLLTPSVLERLCDLRQTSYQISLDGFEEGHDVTRQYASGKGTFAVIWPNLLAARDSSADFRITLRLHLTNDNISTMEKLVEEVAQEFGGDSRFNVFFKTIENLGGPNASKIRQAEKGAAARRVEQLSHVIRSAGLETHAVIEGPESNTGSTTSVGAGAALSATEEDVSGQTEKSSAEKSKYQYSGYICYAAKPNSLMIRADGSIGKCTVLMHDPRNRIGEIRADGTMSLDSELVNKVWMRGFNSMDPTELGCPAQNLPAYEAPVKLLRELPARQ